MKVLVTGHDGYIGVVLAPMLELMGHEVVGLDTHLYEGCSLGPEPPRIEAYRMDVRDVTPALLRGFDAVIHLAAISNDPVGDLNPACTHDLNYQGSVTLARAAKEAGVRRFLFSSSCSLYGAGGEDFLDETAAFYPVTPYGESKILAEKEISELADDNFSPVFLRNATAYGYSSRLRGDLVVNNLVAYAMLTGQVRMKSDGTPWRPLVHIEDVARAFAAVLHAPLEAVHNEAFNVGRTEENYQIRDVAEIVECAVPGSRITLADSAGPDIRNYRVNCDKLSRAVPSFRPIWTVPAGVDELVRSYQRHALTLEQLHGPNLMRIQRVRHLIHRGQLDSMLRWTPQHVTKGGAA
jgi:nucleoside-diphosphate-sugar epimerase